MRRLQTAALGRLMAVLAIAIGLCAVLAAGGRPETASITDVPTTASPRTAATYTLPTNDGYGVASCLAERLDCGAGVAEALCAAHGHQGASSYGPVEGADAVSVDCRA